MALAIRESSGSPDAVRPLPGAEFRLAQEEKEAKRAAAVSAVKTKALQSFGSSGSIPPGLDIFREPQLPGMVEFERADAKLADEIRSMFDEAQQGESFLLFLILP